MRAAIIVSVLTCLAHTGVAIPVEVQPAVSLLGEPESVGTGAPVYIRKDSAPLQKRQDDGFVPISGRQTPDGAPVYLGEDLAPYKKRNTGTGAPVYLGEDVVPIKKPRL